MTFRRGFDTRATVFENSENAGKKERHAARPPARRRPCVIDSIIRDRSIIDRSSSRDQSLSASAVGGGAPPAQTGQQEQSPQSSSSASCLVAGRGSGGVRLEGTSGSGRLVAAEESVASTSSGRQDLNESAMIMDGLETMSFAEANVHFHHLLNFDTFKAEMPDDSANQVSGIVRRSETNSINDSLNTPISGFMDLPIFFGPSVVLPIPSVLTGKRNFFRICRLADAAAPDVIDVSDVTRFKSRRTKIGIWDLQVDFRDFFYKEKAIANRKTKEGEKRPFGRLSLGGGNNT